MAEIYDSDRRAGNPDALESGAEPYFPGTRTAASVYEKQKLRLAGALNLVGDLSLLAESWRSKNLSLKLAGWFYTIGASIVTLFGAPNKTQLVRDLNERAASFIQAQSTELSDSLESSRVLNTRDTSALGVMGRMLRRYSAEFMLWFYTFGAGAMLSHGITQRRLNPAKPVGDILVGASSLVVKLAAIAMPENSRSSDDVVPSRSKSTLEWLAEKPMRLFGYGSLATESFWAFRTFEKFKAGTKWKWSATTTGSYALSDILIANTNKDAANAVGVMTEPEQSHVERMLAETIARQPKARHEQLSSQAAEFLRKEPIVKGTTVQLRDAIISRVKQLESERENSSSAAHRNG